MTKSEADNIIQAIERTNKKDESAKLVEAIFKLVSTASLALVMWVLTTVNSMQKDLVQQSSDITYMRNSIEKLESFSGAPRFTQEHFEMQISPLVKTIQNNNEQINRIQDRLADQDTKIQQILIDLNKLK